MTTCIGENLVIKKLILVLFAAVLTAFPAAASEDAVKQAVIREYEMIRDGKFSEMLPLYTKDYSSISASKRKTTYKDIQIMSLMLDGKHPEEFMLFLSKAKSGKNPLRRYNLYKNCKKNLNNQIPERKRSLEKRRLHAEIIYN